ncbi:MAG: SDR family oxidoreductase [Deltaproteobacteria bacterium]|nr:SDR family oxidoreductase [Deltaproteobacteria bacterium]
MKLAGRVALVTAGSKGIGRATALRLAQDGADVAISYASDEVAAAACVAAIEALGRRAFALRAPAEDLEAGRRLVARTQETLGPIGILVNNAGVDWDGTPVAETKPEELLRVMTINALAPHHLSRLVLPAMRGLGRGDIVMVSSMVTEVKGAGYAPYCMSKAALEALATVLGKEERAHGIHVNTVAPGLVETPLGMRYVTALGGKAMRDFDAVVPYGRVCQPEQVASVIAFLVSEDASYLNGQRIYVHGGGQ